MANEAMLRLATLMSMAVGTTKTDLKLKRISPGEIEAIEKMTTFYGEGRGPSFGFYVAAWLAHLVLDENACNIVKSCVRKMAKEEMERRLLEEKEGEHNG